MANSMERIEDLIGSGQLRFVYVLGLARSGSTIVARTLGAALDGTVYEPATPARLGRLDHYARTILRAYDLAQRETGSDRPVSLCIKDLSLFVDAPRLSALLARAAHLVVTVREPRAQQASLTAMLRHEFSIWQRVEIIFRAPFEALGMAWHFLAYGRRFLRDASRPLGFRLSQMHRLAIAGWNLDSWQRLEALLAASPAMPVTIIDAGAARRDPAGTAAELAAIAATIAPIGPRASVSIAGHCRMLPRSKWAAEALRSSGINAGPQREPLPPPDAFDQRLLDLTEPAYSRVLSRRSSTTVTAAASAAAAE
ncbi:MAG: hypothetical protein EOP22_13450 [Hyphomicrobiales bacterium]|nr:MAG: hypothetical protein EOP22_13450 [Hyphomicrobiales bacterium]